VERFVEKFCKFWYYFSRIAGLMGITLIHKKMRTAIKNVHELKVYQMAFDTAMQIFIKSKEFPKEEKYSLTDQIRRSSRSVCSNLAEGWNKREYRAAFACKLTEAVQESAETQTWLEFSLKCGYLDLIIFKQLHEKYEHIMAQLLTMKRKSSTFIIPS